MPETYFDSAAERTITKARAMRELRDHGVTSEDDIAAFLAECGERDEYDAQTVLRWLGY